MNYNALNPVSTDNPFFCTAECTHNFESSAPAYHYAVPSNGCSCPQALVGSGGFMGQLRLPTAPGALRMPRSDMRG
jgi:hypothetical protein